MSQYQVIVTSAQGKMDKYRPKNLAPNSSAVKWLHKNIKMDSLLSEHEAALVGGGTIKCAGCTIESLGLLPALAAPNPLTESIVVVEPVVKVNELVLPLNFEVPVVDPVHVSEIEPIEAGRLFDTGTVGTGTVKAKRKSKAKPVAELLLTKQGRVHLREKIKKADFVGLLAIASALEVPTDGVKDVEQIREVVMEDFIHRHPMPQE